MGGLAECLARAEEARGALGVARGMGDGGQAKQTVGQAIRDRRLLPEAGEGEGALATVINARYLAPEDLLVRELADLARLPERRR